MKTSFKTYRQTMAQLYLVAFQENNYGSEPEINYALRDLLSDHCSFCIPAGKTKVFGGYPNNGKIAEIIWLMNDRLEYQEQDYLGLIDSLRELYKNRTSEYPQEWHDYYRLSQSESKQEQSKFQQLWEKEKGWIFQKLISKWTKLRRPRPITIDEAE